MYQLLIVDDEIHAVHAVHAGVIWEELRIVKIHTAYNIGQAKEIFQHYPIDLMICDIEMPQGSGIDLLVWVREHYPATESVFLTCHSSFEYAQQAVQLGSLDYLLKPVKFKELQAIVQKGLERRKERREQQINKETSDYYSRLWQTHQPALIEQFWQDLLNYRLSSSPEKMKHALHENQLPLTEYDPFLPVIIAVQRWQRPLSSRDERIMEYALHNAANYLILHHYKGYIVRYGADSRLLVLLFQTSGNQLQEGERALSFRRKLESYMDACQQYFNCELACYVGEATPVYQLATQFSELLKLYKQNKQSKESAANTTSAAQMFFLQDLEKPARPMEQTLELVYSFIAEHIHDAISRDDVAHMYICIQTIYRDCSKRKRENR